MKILKTTLMLAGLMVAGTVSVKAQKISQDSIKMLLLQKEYLKTSVDINDLKIKLANERNNNESIRGDIQDKMRMAELAAADSKKLASKTDVESSKSIKRAATAADKASKLSRDVEKLNAALKKSDAKIEDYLKEINKLEILKKKLTP